MTCARCGRPIRSDNRSGLCEVCYHIDYRESHREQARLHEREYRRADVARYLVQVARRRAKARGILFAINEADLIVGQFCPLLGIELRAGELAADDHSPSIDRIDPKFGYVPGNVRVISHLANRMKSNASPEDLFIFAAAVIESRGLTICEGEST